MPKISAEARVSRRLRFRDLHVFLAVVECGSMGKAAVQLGTTQPSVSELISGLESTIGARLFDRNAQGVEPTLYGQALSKRAIAAFDELKQGLRDLEYLANPTIGEIRIGCPVGVVHNPADDDHEILPRVSGNCAAIRSGTDPDTGGAGTPCPQIGHGHCLAIRSEGPIRRQPQC
jgi:Bacterial regulatory helix-turn-helix protein, lysR family